MTNILYIITASIILYSCSHTIDEKEIICEPVIDTTIYTAYSSEPSPYLNFDSQKAINTIADIENSHFRDYNSGKVSRYYGTEWRKAAEMYLSDSQKSEYEVYTDLLGTQADSMHCTLYAVEALKNGLDSLWTELETHHHRIYQDHEHAGWSIAYILVKNFGWEAHLIIDELSSEFDHCQRRFATHKSYPVYKQPDIPLTSFLVTHKQDSSIQNLLNKHEFGWGFSYQGWHTWITKHTSLKECIWSGSPSKELEKFGLPLFRETPFLDYQDYNSHILVFPQLKNK